MEFDTNQHSLVPVHKKLSDAEKEQLCKDYFIQLQSLPKIMINDSAVVKLKPKVGDVIKIERESKTAGRTAYYRVIIDE